MPQGVKIALGLIFLVALLIFNTPITRVGSGFIIDKGKYVFTYTGLVTGSKSISIKFPNEENIQAKSIYVDRESNIAILKMDKIPKVKRRPLVFSNNGFKLKNNYVFTLGYPWTNTQEDKYHQIEGSLISRNLPSENLMKLKIPMDPVNSGGPLFNAKGELIGMLIMGKHLVGLNRPSENLNYVIGQIALKNALRTNNLYNYNLLQSTQLQVNPSEHIKSMEGNIVLIEATIK